MPRFHFHIQDGRRVSDEEGVELTDLRTARRYALRYLVEILRDSEADFWRDKAFILTTTDDEGHVLFTIDVRASDSARVAQASPD